MKAYKVTVQKTEWAEAEFEVEAETETEAEQKALEKAGNHIYGRWNEDYEVMYAEEMERPV